MSTMQYNGVGSYRIREASISLSVLEEFVPTSNNCETEKMWELYEMARAQSRRSGEVLDKLLRELSR